MDSDAHRALVEAVARGMYERLVPPDPWWEGEDKWVHELWMQRATAALTAALALSLDQECPTCARLDADGDLEPLCPNPDCTNGTVPGEPALVALLVETGVLEPWSVYADGELLRYPIRSDVHPLATLYRIRPASNEGEEPA